MAKVSSTSRIKVCRLLASPDTNCGSRYRTQPFGRRAGGWSAYALQEEKTQMRNLSGIGRQGGPQSDTGRQCSARNWQMEHQYNKRISVSWRIFLSQ